MKKSDKNFIIDFDSTFTQLEALDILCEVSLRGKKEKKEVSEKIKNLTELGMSGKISFRKSLTDRIKLLKANRDHLPLLEKKLRKVVSQSFRRNKEFFNTYGDHVYIISNGFKEFIEPIVTEYGVKPHHIYANTFKFNKKGDIIGFDTNNMLSSNNGKVKQLQELNLQGEVYVIGDGYTDYEIKLAGLANKFIAFTENIERDQILEHADHIAPSLDEFLYVNKMNTALSYPKNRIKVLLLEKVHSKAFDLLKEEGYTIEEIPGSLDEEELCEKIRNVSILGIRSKTQVTAKVLEYANRLITLGAYCIGTNQIDLEACAKNGVAVFNAPYSNTRSVVELAISEIILLMRRLPDPIYSMREGIWSKSSVQSNEIRGKKLGIIGYGNIGSQLSVIAESIGMDIYYYDINEKLAMGNATKCNSLKELLSKCDVLSLHVDGRKYNTNLIGAKELKWFRKGSVLINLSRGNVVDLKALKDSLLSGRIKGAAIDVFPSEPKTNNEKFLTELQAVPNVILTPHIGGSTEEAQMNIANFVPNKIMEYINTGRTISSVNFPNLQLPELEDAHRLIHIHNNIPGVMAKINYVLAKHNINILGQHLKTDEIIGYVITDIDKAYNKDVIQALKEIEGTIKFRVLY